MVLFELGRVLFLNGAFVIDKKCVDLALERHQEGQWGELRADEVGLPDKALEYGVGALSRHTDNLGRKFKITSDFSLGITFIEFDPHIPNVGGV